MVKMIKVALAGAGAFGIKHLDGIKNIDGVEVISLVGRELDATRQVATAYGIPHSGPISCALRVHREIKCGTNVCNFG